jgi:hypothetical protein
MKEIFFLMIIDNLFFPLLLCLLQVANFEYVNEEKALAAAEEAEREAQAKREAEVAEGPGRSQFWDSLLKDRVVEIQVEEFQELGKGKRSRKQVIHNFCKLMHETHFSESLMGACFIRSCL